MKNVVAVHKGQQIVNWTATELTDEVIRRKEGQIAAGGAISVRTGLRTGRSPRDKFIVDEPSAEGVAWGETNQRISESQFNFLIGSVGARKRTSSHVQHVFRRSFHAAASGSLWTAAPDDDEERSMLNAGWSTQVGLAAHLALATG